MDLLGEVKKVKLAARFGIVQDSQMVEVQQLTKSSLFRSVMKNITGSHILKTIKALLNKHLRVPIWLFLVCQNI